MMNWKQSGRRGRELLDVKSLNLPEGTQENNEKSKSGDPASRPRFETSTPQTQFKRFAAGLTCSGGDVG
jgi:hypothetical protein